MILCTAERPRLGARHIAAYDKPGACHIAPLLGHNRPSRSADSGGWPGQTFHTLCDPETCTVSGLCSQVIRAAAADSGGLLFDQKKL